MGSSEMGSWEIAAKLIDDAMNGKGSEQDIETAGTLMIAAMIDMVTAKTYMDGFEGYRLMQGELANALSPIWERRAHEKLENEARAVA